jgi:trehalose synthase
LGLEPAGATALRTAPLGSEMSELREVELRTLSLTRFAEILGKGPVDAALDVAEQTAGRMSGRVFWNVNSTAVGGGVAEMLQELVRYARGAGVDARWLVIGGSPEFFHVTKRLHHALHGSAGDGSPLDSAAREVYEKTLSENARDLCARVRASDIVLLHDPQTAGLAPHLRKNGAHVVWRCHIGSDVANEHVELGWRFLEPYLQEAQCFVFSRDAYVPDFCDHGKSRIIRPSIDIFSPKNRRLAPGLIRTTLVHTGLVEGPPPDEAVHRFQRADGSWGRIERRADVVRLGRAPEFDTPLVVQVSRWDPLKDMTGVMHGFAKLVDGWVPGGAELVLAGPNVSGVSDDPEGGATLDAVIEAWRELPHAIRARVHIASLPTADIEENAILVNALQRHATVVVQKSLKEGFGLTVTEAMWKSRPVVASRTGGIQDQIEHGKSGILLDDPTDLDEFAGALRRLLEDPEAARRMGKAARARVKAEFLGVRHLLEYAKLISSLDA